MNVAARADVGVDVSAGANTSTPTRPLKRKHVALRRSMSPSSRVRAWGARNNIGVNTSGSINAGSGTSDDLPLRGRSNKRRRRAPSSPAYRPSPASSRSCSRSGSAVSTVPHAAPIAATTTFAAASASANSCASDNPLDYALASAPVTWRAADRMLFGHLAARGREALLPASWLHDFPTLPRALFTSPVTNNAGGSALVSHRYGSAAYGARALSALLEVGPRARDALVRGSSGPRAETLLRRGVEAWWRWCLKDGRVGVEGSGMLVVEEGPLAIKVEVLQQRMVARLRDLHEHWSTRGRSGEAPACYGIIVSHTVMAIVSLEEEGEVAERKKQGAEQEEEVNGHEQDDAHAKAQAAALASQEAASVEQEAALAKGQEQADDGALRTLAVLDFSDPAMDVWNAVAVAIAAVHCRDVVLTAAQGALGQRVGMAGFQLGERDPDA